MTRWRLRLPIGQGLLLLPVWGNLCIIKKGLKNGEDVATCPSCSLLVKVIYDKDQFICGETVPASSTDKELVKCWRRHVRFQSLTFGKWAKLKKSNAKSIASSWVQSFCSLLWMLPIRCQVHLQLKKQVHCMTYLDFVLRTLNWNCSSHILLQQAELKETERAWEAVVETGLQLASTSTDPGFYVPVPW